MVDSTSRGAGSAPTEGVRGSATVPLRRAPPWIHGPRTSGHGGRAINHLTLPRQPDDDDASARGRQPEATALKRHAGRAEGGDQRAAPHAAGGGVERREA